MSESPSQPGVGDAGLGGISDTAADQAAAFVQEILDRIPPGAEPKIAEVTATENTGDYRVKLDILGPEYWAASLDSSLRVGDRVWVLKNGPTYVVQGRLNGGGGGVPIGSMTAYAGGTVPNAWLICDGAAVSRTTYAALFAVIGTSYGGGDGSTTFNVPNLLNRVPLGAGSRSRGSTGGAETVALSQAQMPSHSHSGSTSGAGSHSHYMGIGTTGTEPGGTANVQSGSGATVAGLARHSHSISGNTDSSGDHSHSLTTNTAGSGQAHDNMPPFQVVAWIVKAR